MADWTAIKTEYISDPKASYRKLAEKYSVTVGQIRSAAEREKWQELRAQTQHKTAQKAVQKAVQSNVKQVSGIQQCADGLLAQIALHLSSGEILEADVIAKLTRSIKDLKEIKHDLTEYELREQDMRLRALEKQINAGSAEEDDSLGVIYLPSTTGKLIPPEE